MNPNVSRLYTSVSQPVGRPSLMDLTVGWVGRGISKNVPLTLESA